MIDTDDLMRNNVIQYKGRGIFRVKRIDHNDIGGVWEDDGVVSTENDYPEQFEPIPLTPEILEKCGFEDKNPWQRDNIVIDSESRLIIVDQTGYGVIVARDVTYLHRLQNIFYALKGQELEIKELV